MVRYATFGRRLWALLLTVLVDLVVYGALQAVTRGGEVVPAFGFWFLIHHIGFVVEGGTLGHRLAGLRVVRVDGARVGVLHAFVRELSRLFLSIPPLGLGMLWMLDEPDRRTWHDLLAGTVVVRESAPREIGAPAWADRPPWRVPSRGASEDGTPLTPVASRDSMEGQ